MIHPNMNKQVTVQGAQKTLVQFRDKITGNYLHTKEITKALLAKFYHEQKVTHAINGVPVVDI